MRRVYLNGNGRLSPAAGGAEQFWFKMNEGAANNGSQSGRSRGQIEVIPPLIPPKAMRRMDRFSTLALFGAIRAVEEGGLKINPTNANRIGTVYSTCYGPIKTNLQFGEYVVNGVPELASPMVFSGTVNNACVGHVCMNLGIKGASTMLLCSNFVGYAFRLIQSGKADSVLAGGVDEFEEGLFKEIHSLGYSVSECASVLLISGEITDHTYCELVAYAEGFLGCHPFVNKPDYVDANKIEEIIRLALHRSSCESGHIDGIVLSCGHLPLYGDAELTAIKKVFRCDEPLLIDENSILDYSLGAALGVQLSIAALQLKHREDMQTILVNHYDTSGGFISFVVSSVKREVRRNV